MECSVYEQSSLEEHISRGSCFRLDPIAITSLMHEESTGEYVLSQGRKTLHHAMQTFDNGKSALEYDTVITEEPKKLPGQNLDVIDLAFNEERNLAVLLRDNRGREAISLYQLQKVLTNTDEGFRIQPTQYLVHPCQLGAKKIEWSRNDPNVLAVGCSGGICVWYTQTKLPTSSSKDVKLGISTFHSFKEGHSVDVIAFSSLLSGYFACSASSSRETKIYSLTETPSRSCIRTISTSRGSVKQLAWSEKDSFLAVRYENCQSIDIFTTSDWSKQCWLFNSKRVHHIEWFTEYSVDKLLIATEDTVTILDFDKKHATHEYSISIDNALFNDCYYFKFHPNVQTLVTVRQDSVWSHSLYLEYSVKGIIGDMNQTQAHPKDVLENLSKFIVFLDRQENIHFLLPKLLI